MATQDKIINDTSAVILALLHQEPMIGSHLIELAEKWINPYFSTTRSAFYRDLISMQGAGLVRESGKGPRSSTEYRITPAGKRAYQKWAHQPVELDSIRNSIALRVAFADLMDSKRLKSLIEDMKRQHNAAKIRAQGLLDEARHNDLGGDEQAMRFVISYHEMTMQWLDNIKV